LIQRVNLIPAGRQLTRRYRQRAKRWVLGCAAYAALLLVVGAAVRSISGGASSAIATELEQVRAAIEQTNHSMSQLQPRLARSRTTLAASRSVGTQPDWSVLMGLVAQLLGDDTVLVSCTIEPVEQSRAATVDPSARPPDRYLLRISGLGQDHTAVSAFVLRLEQTQLFQSVKLIDTRKEPFRKTQAVGFHIECALSGSSGEQ
jgi:Tfp pilus assembly protein PilN